MDREVKLIKDRECIHCERFWECKGKPEGIQCVAFTTRKGKIMTDNESNMSIKYAVCVLEAIGNGLTLSNENDREDACVLAIQALEEIQQYRAIGTVEELEAMKKGTLSAMELLDIWCVLEDLKKYSAIGTIEEFKALKEEVELYRNLDKTNFSDGYNRAIDEFASKCKEKVIQTQFSRLEWFEIDEIARELKTARGSE